MNMEFLDGFNELRNDRKLDALSIVFLFFKIRPDCMDKTAICSGRLGDVTIAFKLSKTSQRRCIIEIYTAAFNIAVSEKGACKTVDATKLCSSAGIIELIACVSEAVTNGERVKELMAAFRVDRLIAADEGPALDVTLFEGKVTVSEDKLDSMIAPYKAERNANRKNSLHEKRSAHEVLRSNEAGVETQQKKRKRVRRVHP